MYKIEKGIPVSPKQTNETLVFLWSLKAGDSFLVSDDREMRRIVAVAKRAGIDTIVRMADNGQYRIWRESRPTTTVMDALEAKQAVRLTSEAESAQDIRSIFQQERNAHAK